MNNYLHQPAHWVAGDYLTATGNDSVFWYETELLTEGQIDNTVSHALKAENIGMANDYITMLIALQVYDQWWESVAERPD